MPQPCSNVEQCRGQWRSLQPDLEPPLSRAIGYQEIPLERLLLGQQTLIQLINAGEECIKGRQDLFLQPCNFLLTVGAINPGALNRLPGVALQEPDNSTANALEQENWIFLCPADVERLVRSLAGDRLSRPRGSRWISSGMPWLQRWQGWGMKNGRPDSTITCYEP